MSNLMMLVKFSGLIKNSKSAAVNGTPLKFTRIYCF